MTESDQKVRSPVANTEPAGKLRARGGHFDGLIEEGVADPQGRRLQRAPFIRAAATFSFSDFSVSSRLRSRLPTQRGTLGLPVHPKQAVERSRGVRAGETDPVPQLADDCRVADLCLVSTDNVFEDCLHPGSIGQHDDVDSAAAPGSACGTPSAYAHGCFVRERREGSYV